jgi:hypothetical protein
MRHQGTFRNCRDCRGPDTADGNYSLAAQLAYVVHVSAAGGALWVMRSNGTQAHPILGGTNLAPQWRPRP